MTTHRFMMEVDVPDDIVRASDERLSETEANDWRWWADAAAGVCREYGAVATFWQQPSPPDIITIPVSDKTQFVVLDPGRTAWEATGDEDDKRARLTFEPVLVVAGLPMHVEAYAVDVDEDGMQTGATPWAQDALDAILAIYQPEAPWALTQINGRDYVVVAYPHGD